MKAGWKTKTLNQITENLDNKRVPITKADRVNGEYPYYGASGIVDYVAGYIFDCDTLLVSEDGANLLARSTPIAFPASGKYWVNNHAHILKFENMITQRFVEMYLESIPLDRYITGAAQPKLNQMALNSIPIPVAPFSEQQRIVGILDEAFDGIAIAKANTEENLKNARALFESHLQSVFTQRGEGWAEKPLSDVCDLLNGFAFKSGDAVPESETQLVRMGNLYGNSLNLDRSPVFYLDSFAVDYCKYILKEGDLIMSLTGTTGKEDYGYVVRIPECNYDLLMNQRIAKFDSIREDLVNRDYLMHYLRSRVFLDILYPTANGTRQANLSSVIIKTLPIPLCSIREQKMIASSLESLSDEIQHLESIYQRKLVALDELKKSLLHQAFTGQLSTHFIETTIL